MKKNILERIKLAVFSIINSNVSSKKGQPLLLVKMVRYLLIKDEKGDSTKAIRHRLISSTGGMCYGLSVVNQAMKLLGQDKHLQWKTALCQLANWDGEKASLEKKIPFPGFKEAITVDKVFEYILNYSIFHQGVAKGQETGFMLAGLRQSSLLNPKGYFEIVFSDEEKTEKIKRIEDRQVIVGCFTKKELLQLLDEEQAENYIFVLRSLRHAINIFYRSADKKWVAHDPNYEHSTLDKIEKCFTTKAAVIDEVIACLNFPPLQKFNASMIPIAIEIATWDANKKIKLDNYNKLLENPPLEIFNEGGLSLLVRYRLDLLFFLLDKPIFKANEASDFFAKALEVCDRGFTALHFMANRNSEVLLDLLDKNIFQSVAVIKSFARVLAGPLEIELTILHFLVAKKPEAMLSLLDKNIFKSEVVIEAFSRALKKQNVSRATFLHLIVYLKPELLVDLLEKHIFKCEIVEKCFFETLEIADKEGWTVLPLMIKLNPEKVIGLLEKNIFKSNKANQFLLKNLKKETPEGLTALDFIAILKPQIFVYLLRKNIIQAIDLNKENIYGRSPWSYISHENKQTIVEIKRLLAAKKTDKFKQESVVELAELKWRVVKSTVAGDIKSTPQNFLFSRSERGGPEQLSDCVSIPLSQSRI